MLMPTALGILAVIARLMQDRGIVETDFDPMRIRVGTALMLMLAYSASVGGLLTPVRTDILWRVAFLAGLIGAPAVWALFAQLPPVEINAGYPALIVAGLLVGIGTRYASGCTSGHGVCGLSRLSLRSLVATLSFMATGFITVFVIRHLIGA